MAAWMLVPAGTRTPEHEAVAATGAGAVVVVGGAVVLVVVGWVVVVELLVVVDDWTGTEKAAESVRTSPTLSAIFAVIVCPPAVGDHGLAIPSSAVPLKSKGRELSRLCVEPSRPKATSVIVPLDATKT
jgi:hypothetical protein